MFALFVTALFWLPSLSTTTEFVKPQSVVSEKPNQVTLGLIMVNIKKQSRTTEELFKERLDALVLSLTHHSTVPVLIIVVTDPGTLAGEFNLLLIPMFMVVKMVINVVVNQSTVPILLIVVTDFGTLSGELKLL